ncbi:MAG: leucine-rich repeat protein [Clostridia bacterium]|nr:leucine-rich repeat protein [Clostridia bacterium]
MILGFDSLNDKAYWNICLIRTHSSKEQNIILSDILLKTIPEYTKYLTLVDEKRRFQCIELQKRQEQAFNRRKQKREEEQRLLAEKEEEDRRRREAEARARRKHRIKNISIASLVVAFAISITLFFSMFLPMFFLNNGKLGAYVKYKNLTEFEIPEGTTQIDSNEFKGCGSLTSITIPNSVNRIGDYAFKNCSLLTSVVIGDGVTEIGQHAFNGCGSLTSIEMGVNVESIGSGAFEGCSSLTSITIPDRVTTIGNSAFYDCSSLTSITIPNSVTLIGASAFYGCSSLEEMVIPFVGMTKDGTTNTGFSYIFIGHGGNNHMVPKSLKKVTINAGSIGNRAFANCSSLTTVIVGNGVTSIGEDAFYACSLLTSVQIADSVTLIGSGAFKLCTSLEEITIPFVGETKVGIGETHFGYILGVISSQHNDFVPTSLKKVTVTGGKIVSHAFRDCTSLTSIVIGDGVTSIGSGAFYGCSSLTSIVIGDGVTSIGDYVFDDTAYYNDESNWENGILYIGKYLIKAKTTISGSYSVKEGTLCVANEAFRNCSSLTSIIIPDSVTSIGDDAFTACFSLTIYAEAESKPSGWGSKWNGSNRPVIWNFKGYGTQSQDFEYYVTNDNKAHLTKYKGSASEVVIPESLGNATVTSIEDSAFYNCSSLVSVVIPDSVTTIEANAFTGCSSLTSITVSEKNEHYSSLNGDLYNKAKTSLIKYAIGKQDAFFAIPNSVTMIATGAFDGCNSLNSIEIGDSVIAIEVGAFDGCNSLMEITIPFVGSTKDGVDNTYFGYIFSGNNNNLPKSLKKVTVTGGKIANNAFYGCSSLTSVVIGDNVTSIGNGAFDGCISLEEIIVPFVGATKDGTTNTHFGYIFGAYSSSDNDNYVPTSLKKVTVSGGKIANSAFSGCDSLTSIEIGDNVTSIGNDAFDGCYRLVEVVNKSTHITIEKGSWDNGNVGYYALAVYNNSDNFGGTKLSTDNGCVIYTDGTEKILVSYIGNETQLIIPSYITQINDYAFYKCRSLTSVKMGDRVTSIGEKAFYWCTSLASIKIPNSVISIGSQAFESCISLTSIEIPNSVTSIDASAFYNTAYYNNEENWENGVLYIGKYLIQAKTTVSSDYSVKEGTLLIGDYAFCYCSSLTSVEIGDSITSIGSYAFNNCTSLTSVEIPNSVTSIGYSAFEDCSSLTSIEIPAGVTSIGWHAFYGCSSLTSIVIPSRVTFIDNYAFASCKTLTIYCEASSQPSGWEKNWNYSDRPVYWYRETQPTTSGNYWHYVNGVPTKW